MRRIQDRVTCRYGLWGLAMVLVAAAPPAPARAQQGEAPASESEVGVRLRQVRDHFGPAVSARIDDVLASARKAGVPEDVLVTKALEGAAKGVSGPRVVDALQAYSKRLETANRLLGGSPRTSVLVAAADALEKGVDPVAIRDVGRAAGGDPLALVVLGDLNEARVPTAQAVEVVREALSQGKRGDGLLDISAEVRRNIREGKPPGQAAQAVTQALKGGGPPGPAGQGSGKGGGPPAGRPKGGGPPHVPHGPGGG